MALERPSDGFRIIVSTAVEKYIEAETEDNFRVAQFWSDILERLKYTALRESLPLESQGVPKFLFIADGAPEFGIPTIKLIFEGFFDTLTITNALVYQEGDYSE
jgi:hypothetical protein